MQTKPRDKQAMLDLGQSVSELPHIEQIHDWFRSEPSQNALKLDLKKSRICSIYVQSDSLYAQTRQPCCDNRL